MENYESLGVIGEGTYGVVMKARHKETGQVVAIKKFKESDEDEQVRKTSLREVRVLKQLRHDNVITLLEVFRRKGKLYLVFEYVEKTILEVLERKPNGLDEQEVRKYTYQLLRGVEYCHAHNIIHRDVKPENILISKNGALKLCDFGFARPMSVGGKYTDYVATRWYRSPELLVGDVEYGKGVDVWAIGCIFAEISNGMPLFAGESDVDQLAHIMRCLGKLTNRQVQIFRRNPLYVGVELPVPSGELETLDMRFPQVPRNWLNFLKACLKNDADQRETCGSLTALPYFTDRNFKNDYDAELKMIMDKENRSNTFKRAATADTPQQPGSSGLGATTQPPRAEAPPIGLSNNKNHYSNMGSGGGGGGGGQQSGSLWNQYLQSTTSDGTSGSGPGGGKTSGGGGAHSNKPGSNALFPGLAGSSKYGGGGGGSQLGGSGGGGSSFLPQTQGGNKNPYSNPYASSGSHSHQHAPHTTSGGVGGGGGASYMSTYNNTDPMVITNGASSSTSGASKYSGGVYGSKKSTGGTQLPTLGPSGGGGGGGSSGWGAPSSQPQPSSLGSTGGGGGGAASQLAYKKKPNKRNVLSTLSLTAFGGQQSSGLNEGGSGGGGGAGPTQGGSSGLMMLHGQSHSLDNAPGRRGSKPWM